MSTKKLPLKLSLQFFGNESTGSETPSVSATADPLLSNNGDASPRVQSVDEQASAPSDDQLEMEFEKLIKGGRFENAFKKRTQGIIDKRFKTLKSLEESQAKQKPIFDLLSAKYGTDPSNIDELLEKMQNDISPKSESAPEVADKKTTSVNRDEFISQKAKALAQRWAQEGEQLKKIFPSFDFKTELNNPAFASLLKSGLPLRKAYTAAHSDEILKSAVSGTAKKAAMQTLQSIRANGNRVSENGLHNGSALLRKTDVSNLSGSDIRSIIKQVENGKKIRL